MKRILVTTAIEQTWPKNGPVLFLGEWCRLYNRKSIWDKLDAEIIPYHWDDRTRQQQDYHYLQSLYEALLEELAEKLNQLHGVEHSLRYWRILTGPWLGYFIQMLFDRWAMLKRAIKECEIDKCRVLIRDPHSIIPNDMAHFQRMYFEDGWNEAIYGQLLKQCWRNEIDIEEVERGRDLPLEVGKEVPQSLRARVKKFVKGGVVLVNRVTTRPFDFFFLSSYLPLDTDFKLQLKLGQFPKLWRRESVPVVKPDLKMRRWELRSNKSADKFSTVAKYMIPHHMPTAYLEGYQSLMECVDNLPWPKRPKGIFTSNAFSSDDVFKVWVAERIEDDGTPLIIGQHGGHYGIGAYSGTEEHEIKIADRYLSWGWSDKNNPKIVPVGNLHLMGRRMTFDLNGTALMVEMALPRYSYHMYSVPVAGQWCSYFEEQCRFISALPVNIRQRVLVRLFPHDYDWKQEARWRDEFPSLRLDNGSTAMRHRIKQSRIFISTYNATSYLESLGWNMPTLIFWNPDHWELREEVIPYFDLLKSVGIFHETPESAAHQMIAVWDEVSSWWGSQAVQNARKIFCERYSRLPDKPLAALESMFRKVSSPVNAA